MSETQRLCARCNYVITTERYCEKCKQIIEREERERKAKKKPNKFYSSKYWRTIRQFILERDNYLCQICLSKGKYVMASEIDHIIPIANGGTNDPTNLRALCKSCHSRKTIKELNKRDRLITPPVGGELQK